MYKLTVIVALYNVKEYVVDCINSFVNANPQKNEVRLIIVNDGSTDNSRELIESFESHPNIVILDKVNGGVSSARNAGLDYALGTTEYVGFLDADDLLSLDYFTEFDRIYLQHKPDIIEFNANFFSDWRTIKFDVSQGHDELADVNDAFLARIVNNGMWFAWSRIYKVELFEHLRFSNGRRYEDMILVPSLYVRAKQVYSSSKVLYLYRANSNGITHNGKASDVDDILYAVKVFGLLKLSESFNNKFKRKALNVLMPILVNISHSTIKPSVFRRISESLDVSTNTVFFLYSKASVMKPIKDTVKFIARFFKRG
ncbi:glycosyltransferase [Aeromonas veronii]